MFVRKVFCDLSLAVLIALDFKLTNAHAVQKEIAKQLSLSWTPTRPNTAISQDPELISDIGSCKAKLHAIQRAVGDQYYYNHTRNTIEVLPLDETACLPSSQASTTLRFHINPLTALAIG